MASQNVTDIDTFQHILTTKVSDTNLTCTATE
jgi:hypothetical protein